ncbi:MAG: rhomboid family intramembrane serine protease [Erysipelotrichaceae bacterium]|nr:rhomboid family intramembrane serine protease [Erysipelotrichaceae bacterium]
MTPRELERLEIAVYFIREYGYTFVKTNLKDPETWLCNRYHKKYPIIRISHDTFECTRRSMERMNRVSKAISANINASNRILDIHIGNEAVEDSIEQLDCVYLDVGKISGTDVERFYPSLKFQLKEVEDIEKEAQRLNNELKVEDMHRSSKSNKLDDLKRKPIITYTVMAICMVIYLLSLWVNSDIQHESNTAVILLGYYKTFVLAGDWWRIFTGGFVHVGFLHLFTNVYSLFLMGRALEGMYGKSKYALLLFGSILCGNLFVFVLEGNIVAIGLSGGLYGLMASTLIFAFNSGSIKDPVFRVAISRTLMINLMINFLPNVGVFAHLGGFVFGALVSFLITNNVKWKEMQRNTMIALGILGVALGYKVYDSAHLDTLYPGTDIKVIDYYRNMGLNHYADRLEKHIIEIYEVK